MPDVTVTIDGTTIRVPAGTNIVDAARLGGVAIPVFCYHPKMKPVGMCRMCLVEVYTPKVDPATRQVVMGEDGKPVLALMMNKLQTGCTTPVSDGMVVNTVSDRVKFAQKGVLEFLLSSHPLDCPVCDKGGECPLQNLTMQWGPETSRFDYSDKIHFQKPIPLSEVIYLDRERCILCSRCVRFEDEIADDNVLGFDNRGRKWEIISKSQPGFDSKFSGNTTDICPVGALTSADFRFKSRVWELKSTPQVCNLCPAGCNTSADTRHNELKRMMPRENDAVNEIWMCDKGRFGQRYSEQPDRLTTPLIKRNGQHVAATWEEAYALIGEKLGGLSGAQVAGLAGPKLSNEDFFFFNRLFREVLQSSNLDHRSGGPADLPIDDQPRQFGVGKGTDLSKLGKGTAVLVLGADPEEEASIYQLRLRGIAQRGGDLTVANGYPTKLERSATRKVRVRPGSEAQLALALIHAVLDEKLTNAEFVTNRLRTNDDYRRVLGANSFESLVAATGLAADVIRATARAFASAENGIIVYGRTAAADPAIPQALAALAALTGKVGKANSGLIALRPGGNFRGALDFGIRPDIAAGGLSAAEVWKNAGGNVKAAYIAALNPAADNPQIAQALQNLQFLVVQDLYLTETAQYADVVLPAAAPIERDGTYTNAERRVQRFRQARPTSLPADWQSFQAVAQAVLERTPVAVGAAAPAKKGGKPTSTVSYDAAKGWGALIAADVNAQIVSSVPSYAGTSYTALSNSRGSWGRQPNEAFYYDGTSYENTEGVGIQLAATAEEAKGIFQIGLAQPQGGSADAGKLTLIPVARAYSGGSWVRGSKLASRQVPAHVILSTADSGSLNVGLGELVTVTSAAGSVTLPVQIETGLDAGAVLIPDVAGANLGAVLTGAHTAVSLAKAE
ncbi:NADH-quinone oxidoreductase subunit NuoG [Chloroflexia bacterium SDU3-3]|nr:NADH-quinone oxidoreductase subunit NuoG [Chloroflexia bacterium SDU3-3]